MRDDLGIETTFDNEPPEGLADVVDAVRHTAGSGGAKPFEAVLIGKDGGAKQRWTTPVTPEALFAIIDAIPMRANEMRR